MFLPYGKGLLHLRRKRPGGSKPPPYNGAYKNGAVNSDSTDLFFRHKPHHFIWRAIQNRADPLQCQQGNIFTFLERIQCFVVNSGFQKAVLGDILPRLSEQDRYVIEAYIGLRDDLEYETVKAALRCGKRYYP